MSCVMVVVFHCYFIFSFSEIQFKNEDLNVLVLFTKLNLVYHPDNDIALQKNTLLKGKTFFYFK